jgi:hypothetical protein
MWRQARNPELWQRAARVLSRGVSLPAIRAMTGRTESRFIDAVKRAASFEELAEKHKKTLLHAEKELDLKEARQERLPE